MALRKYTTYLPCPGALIPRSIIIENSCDNIDVSYNAVAHLWHPEQPSVFSHIVINLADRMFHFFKNSIVHFLCAVVVEESCLVSLEKNE